MNATMRKRNNRSANFSHRTGFSASAIDSNRRKNWILDLCFVKRRRSIDGVMFNWRVFSMIIGLTLLLQTNKTINEDKLKRKENGNRMYQSDWRVEKEVDFNRPFVEPWDWTSALDWQRDWPVLRDPCHAASLAFHRESFYLVVVVVVASLDGSRMTCPHAAEET